MKRILILLLVFALCLPCGLAEEIGELAPPTVNQPSDPNEIGELGGGTTPNAATTGSEPVEESTVTVNNNEIGEEPAAVNEVVEEPAVAPTASGETVAMKNVILAVPAGWSVVSNTDDTANGGAITLQMTADDGSNKMLQGQSQSIGTQENVDLAVTTLGKEGLLSQTLLGTMQGMGIVIEEYDYVEYNGGIACVKASENVTMSVGECAMSVAVLLDGTHMVVVMMVLQGVDAVAGAELMEIVLSPMAQ